MAALTWTEALALQQPHMDQTHREFVDLLNAVEAVLDQGPEAAKRALDRFVDHTVEHFAQEDAWMAQIGFAPENCHGVQHRQVLEVLREVQQRLHSGDEVQLVRGLVPALAQWFPAHAQTMDAGLALSLQEAGLDPSAAAPAAASTASA